MPQFQEAVLVATRRTAVGKAGKGVLRNTRPDDFSIEMLKTVLASLGDNFPKEIVDDVVMGCAMPEAEQGLNIARMIGLGAGLPDSSSAITINRFCSSGLQAIATVAERVQLGVIDCGIGGGVESMSMVPMGGNKASLSLDLVKNHPEYYISMGITAENVAQRFEISREDQDAFSIESHKRAVAAIEAGKFTDEIVPITTAEGKTHQVDEGPRADTSIEALAKLRPAFHVKGSVTAGNSSQMNDAAAASVVMSKAKAEELGLTPLARFVGFAVAGVAPDVMGIGPIEAIPKVLKQTGLTLGDIDVFELNEAFAAQSLAVIRKLGLDMDKVNPSGGAISLGHPLGCTGAKLTATAVHELHRRQGRYAMVTMCIGGGMGAAGIFERM
ncbi:MAG: acetyl-CoA C-acyltransferase [Nannocystales bacterium]